MRAVAELSGGGIQFTTTYKEVDGRNVPFSGIHSLRLFKRGHATDAAMRIADGIAQDLLPTAVRRCNKAVLAATREADADPEPKRRKRRRRAMYFGMPGRRFRGRHFGRRKHRKHRGGKFRMHVDPDFEFNPEDFDIDIEEGSPEHGFDFSMGGDHEVHIEIEKDDAKCASIVARSLDGRRIDSCRVRQFFWWLKTGSGIGECLVGLVWWI